MLLLFAVHADAVIVVFTPGPVTVQDVVIPVAVTVSAVEPPDEIRFGFAAIVTVGLVHPEGGTTIGEQAGYVPVCPESAQVGAAGV